MFNIFTKTDPRYLCNLSYHSIESDLWLRSILAHFSLSYSGKHFPSLVQPSRSHSSVFPRHDQVDISRIFWKELELLRNAAALTTGIDDIFELTFELCDGFINFDQPEIYLGFYTFGDMRNYLYEHLVSRTPPEPRMTSSGGLMEVPALYNTTVLRQDLKLFLLLSFLHTYSMTIKPKEQKLSKSKNPLSGFAIPLKSLDITGLAQPRIFSQRLDANHSVIAPFLQIFTRYAEPTEKPSKAPSFKHIFLSPLTVDFISNIIFSKNISISPFYQYYHTHYESDYRKLAFQSSHLFKGAHPKLRPKDIPSRFYSLSLSTPSPYITKLFEDLFPDDSEWMLTALPTLNQYLLERLTCLNLVDTIYTAFGDDTPKVSGFIKKFALSPFLKYRQIRAVDWQEFLVDLPKLVDHRFDEEPYLKDIPESNRPNMLKDQSYIQQGFESLMTCKIEYHITILLPLLEIIFTEIAFTALAHKTVKITDFVDKLCKNPSSEKNFIKNKDNQIVPRTENKSSFKNEKSGTHYLDLYEDVLGEFFHYCVELSYSSKTDPLNVLTPSCQKAWMSQNYPGPKLPLL